MSKNTVEHDSLDQREFTEMKEKVGKLNEIIEDGQETLDTADKLSEDVFYSLFKYSPKKKSEEEIDQQYRLNREMIDKLTDMKEYKQMRSHTKMDAFESALSTIEFTDTIIEEADDEDIEEINRQLKDMRDREKDIEDLQSELEELKEQADDEDSLEELEEQLEELQDEQQQKMEKVEDEIDMNTPEIRGAVRKSIQKAKKEVDAMDELMSGFGLDKGDMEALSWEDKIELAEKLKDTEWIHDLAIEIGRMARLAKGVRRNKINKRPEEVMGITQGDDINNTLPSDLALLADDTLEDLFYKRYIEKELVEYELEGKENEGEGPIIACVDTSGSMRGQKDRFAKAIAFALFNVAQRDDRPFYAINFSSTSEVQCYDMNEEETGERYNIMMDFISMFYGNGTDFNTPLEKAIDVIKEDEDYEEADIVFLSDGQSVVRDSLLTEIEELKNKLEFQIIGVEIGYDAGGMETFADRLFDLNDIDKWGDDTAEEIFQLV